MESNDPITLGNEYLFCEVGNELAIHFLEEAREAVKLAGVDPPFELKRRVDRALTEMLAHRTICPHCGEE
jgi:hypothetical protein